LLGSGDIPDVQERPERAVELSQNVASGMQMHDKEEHLSLTRASVGVSSRSIMFNLFAFLSVTPRLQFKWPDRRNLPCTFVESSSGRVDATSSAFLLLGRRTIADQLLDTTRTSEAPLLTRIGLIRRSITVRL
jgi:hypothetical protein